ncbi:hypothetical protein CF326_g7676 [Tilletia indica]|nr:hypothetical protein CF326_g7676 [Tilletia indica]
MSAPYGGAVDSAVSAAQQVFDSRIASAQSLPSNTPGSSSHAPAASSSPQSNLDSRQASGSSNSGANVGGRGVKRRSDGVIYTANKKRIAVHWAFSDLTTRQDTVKNRAKKLGIGLPTLYDWRKNFPEASNASNLSASSPLAAEMRAISTRSAAQNLIAFLTPDDPASASVTQPLPSSATVSSPSVPFIRPDGLGPEAEPEATFGSRGPGILPPELVQELEQAGALASDDEVAAVHATHVDADTQDGAAQFVNETIDLALHLQQSTLAPGTKTNWDRCKRHFLVFWRCLNKIRAEQRRDQEEGASQPASTRAAEVRSSSGESAGLEEVLVSEQKLVTYLNCYVLHKNPRLGDEAIETHIKAITNLWETQCLSGRNSNPHPRSGALLKAFIKAIRRGRSALADARQDDAWKHSLKDGYDQEEYTRISKWYLEQASSQTPQAWTGTAWRARFDFLMQHAIMGRSEDLRNAKLSSLYIHKIPQSRPHPCNAVVVTLKHSKTNVESRKEFGVAARHRDVELCPVGALALFFFERFHVKNEPFPDLSSRASWYGIPLLVDDEDCGAVTWSDQADVVRRAFNDLGISTSKVTHAMRGGGARLAYEAGCSEASIRIHGRWTAGGDQLIERYLTGIAVAPVRALAGFCAEGGDYYLPRTLLEPPASLSDQLWPQATREEAKVRERHANGGQTDQGALSFLELIKWLRVVLLQDAALLSTAYPLLPLWSMPPFSSPAFDHFRRDLTSTIKDTVNPVEVTISQLIPRLGHALAEIRTATSENTNAIKQVALVTSASIDRLQTSLEVSIATLVSALEQRSRKDDGRAAAQHILSASISALAGASASLSTSVPPQSAPPTLLPTAALPPFSSTLPQSPQGPLLPGALSSRASAAELLPSQPFPPSHITASSSGAALSSDFGSMRAPPSLLPVPDFNPEAQATPSSAGPVCSASPSPSLLVLAKEVTTIKQLASLWYGALDGRQGLQQRLDTNDRDLDIKGAAARKQLCRWRRTIAALSEVERIYGREDAVRRMDELLRRDKFGLRTLSDNHLAKETSRTEWISRLSTLART